MTQDSAAASGPDNDQSQSGPENESEQSGRRGRRLRRGAVVSLVLLVLAALPKIVDLAANALTVADHLPSGSSSPERRGGEPANQPARSSSSSSQSAAIQLGCLTGSGGSSIDCELGHGAELFQGSCDTEGLVSWMGGRPDIDVPRGAANARHDGICVADLRVLVEGTAANGFSGANSSVLRKCFDDRTASVVACSQPHTAEYVAAEVGGIADRGACEKAAHSYLGVAIAERSTELRVRVIKSVPKGDDRARCIIEVIGSQRLDRTVRSLRNTQLHWVP